MRELTSHRVNGCNVGLTITAMDEPGSGGANHYYIVHGFDGDKNPSNKTDPNYHMDAVGILFQNGPIKESGINGLTHEVLLAICADRLECFQSGKFACDDNQEALGFIKAAMAVLERRTEKRLARGVEGTHTV